MAQENFDALGVYKLNLDLYTREVQVDGTYTYFGFAIPGTALATAGWLAYRVTDTDGTRMFADGNANFDNVATDLTALTYSY